MLRDKPSAPACQRNQKSILAVIQALLAKSQSLLEIGSGTGQHAIYFAPALPQLTWQASDLQSQLPGINAWVNEAKLDNLPDPISLDVRTDEIPQGRYDAIFTANTLHIMPWKTVEVLLLKVAQALSTGGLFIVYGPFNFEGTYSSDSNRDFDAFLKSRDANQGIRHFEEIVSICEQHQLQVLEKYAMPAQNFILVFISIK